MHFLTRLYPLSQLSLPKSAPRCLHRSPAVRWFLRQYLPIRGIGASLFLTITLFGAKWIGFPHCRILEQLKGVLPINTYSYSYTQTRAGVLDIHFELFLRCANIPDKLIKKILQSVDNRELSAVGIYLESSNCRIAEVEFRIDWEEHQRQVNANGELFDTECPGWKDGVAPEAYILVQRLCERAKEMQSTGVYVMRWDIISEVPFLLGKRLLLRNPGRSIIYLRQLLFREKCIDCSL